MGMHGIGGRGGRLLIDKLISIVVLGSWLSLTLGVGIRSGAWVMIRRGTLSELGLSVGRRPVVIIVCLGLGLYVWIIEGRSGADHVGRRMNGISRTGMVRMS